MSSPYIMALTCAWRNEQIMMPTDQKDRYQTLYAPTQLASTKSLTSNRVPNEAGCDITDRGDFAWREAGLPYYSASYFLQQRFGRRVQKVSIDAGFTCPNVDGTVATGGCTFCDNRSFSPSR